MARSIQSFPCGLAGGPEGLRPQHLNDMICMTEGGGNGDLQLFEVLTSFTNLVLEGKAFLSARHYFFSVLEKKGG